MMKGWTYKIGGMLACLVPLLAHAQSGAGEAALTSVVPRSNWQTAPAPDATPAVPSCLAMRYYEKGYALGIYRSSNGRRALLIQLPQDAAAVPYKVGLRTQNSSRYDFAEQTPLEQVLSVSIDAEPALQDAVLAAETLTVTLNDRPVRFAPAEVADTTPELLECTGEAPRAASPTVAPAVVGAGVAAGATAGFVSNQQNTLLPAPTLLATPEPVASNLAAREFTPPLSAPATAYVGTEALLLDSLKTKLVVLEQEKEALRRELEKLKGISGFTGVEGQAAPVADTRQLEEKVMLLQAEVDGLRQQNIALLTKQAPKTKPKP